MHREPRDTDPTTHHEPGDVEAHNFRHKHEQTDDVEAHALDGKKVPPAQDVEAHAFHTAGTPPLIKGDG